MNLAYCVRSILANFVLLYSFTGSSSAQNLSPIDALTMAGDGLSAGQEIINEAPELISNLFINGLKGEMLENSEKCLGRLQTYTITSAGLDNLLPFSEVWTFEDSRGPVARLNLMINGLRLSGEIYCDDAIIKIDPFTQLVMPTKPKPYSATTFDTALGALLLLQMQGVFDDNDEDTSEIGNNVLDLEPEVDRLSGLLEPSEIDVGDSTILGSPMMGP